MNRTIAALLISASASLSLAACGGYDGPSGEEIADAETANQVFSVVRGTTELLTDYFEPDAAGKQVVQGEEGSVELSAEGDFGQQASPDQVYDRYNLRLTVVFKDYKTGMNGQDDRWTVLNGTVEYYYYYGSGKSAAGDFSSTQIIELTGTGVQVTQGEVSPDRDKESEHVLIEDVIDFEAHNVDNSSWDFSGSITTSSGEVYEIE